MTPRLGSSGAGASVRVTSFSSPVSGWTVSVTVSPGEAAAKQAAPVLAVVEALRPSMADGVSFGSSTPSAGMFGATSSHFAHRDLDVVTQPFQCHLGGDLLRVVHHPQVHLAVLVDVAPAQHLLAGVDVDVVVDPALGEAEQRGLAQRHGRVGDRPSGGERLGALDRDERLGVPHGKRRRTGSTEAG